MDGHSALFITHILPLLTGSMNASVFVRVDICSPCIQMLNTECVIVCVGNCESETLLQRICYIWSFVPIYPRQQRRIRSSRPLNLLNGFNFVGNAALATKLAKRPEHENLKQIIC